MGKRGLCTAVFFAVIICAAGVFPQTIFARTAGIESVIPVRVSADGSGLEYTVVMENDEYGIRKTMKVREGGKGTFTVTHYSPGTYTYTIAEEQPEQRFITMDRTKYRAYICVTEDDDRHLYSSVSLQRMGDGRGSGKSDSASFSNTRNEPDEIITETISPQTGDETGTGQLISALAGSAVSIIVLGHVHRRGRIHKNVTGRKINNAKQK